MEIDSANGDRDELRASLTNKRVKTRKRSYGRGTWPESIPFESIELHYSLDFLSEGSTDHFVLAQEYFETGIFNHPVPRYTILSIVESL